MSRHVARHHYSVKTCRLLCRKKRSEKAAKRRQSRYGWDAENFYENGPKTKTGNVLFFASSRMSMRPTPHLVLLTRLSGTSRRPLGAISKWSRTQHKRKAGPRDGDRHAIKQRAPIRSTYDRYIILALSVSSIRNGRNAKNVECEMYLKGPLERYPYCAHSVTSYKSDVTTLQYSSSISPMERESVCYLHSSILWKCSPSLFISS